MAIAVAYTGKVQQDGTVLLPKEAQGQSGLQPGDEVQVILNHSGVEPQAVTPNEKASAALRRIATLQEGARRTDSSQTDRIIREGREGGMYSDNYIR